jgi:4-amino-4-deoxy-L-arabinose transferase-like glycosyltransferase
LTAPDPAVPAPGDPSRWRHPILLIVLCAALFLPNLGGIPFLGKDEPKNAEALREMMGRGDWVTTTLREEPWFDKPILYYWAGLLFFHALGPGELAARLPSALFGTGTVLLAWGFAQRLFGARVGLRTGVVLATSLEFFWFSRTAVVDLPLAFCVTLSLVAFHRALEGPGNPFRWHVLGFAAAGGATLAKGPVGVVLPALVVGAFVALAGRWKDLTRVPWVRGVAAFLAVAGPWYLIVSLRHGELFWNDFIVNRNLDRYLTTAHRHPGPVTYYLPVLVLGLFPWGALLPFGLARLFRGGRRGLFRARSAEGYLFLWIAMPVLFFSFAGSKLPSYLLPCFPAMAILAVQGWERVLESDAPAWQRRTAVGLLLIQFALLGASLYLWCRSEAPTQLPRQIPLAIGLLGTAAILAVFAARRLRKELFAACAAGMVVSLAAMALFSFANVEARGTLVGISRAAVALSRAGGTVVSYRQFHNGLYFYTENRVAWVKEREDLDRLLRTRPRVYCLLEPKALEELASDPALEVRVLGSQGKVTLARVRIRDRVAV